MSKATFEPKEIVATLINRVYRSGINMMVTLDKAQNKGENISPQIVDDLKADYLLANIELENMLKLQLAQKKDESWSLFVDSFNNLKTPEKLLFKGVIRDVKLTAKNILSGVGNPYVFDPFELPPYLIPVVEAPNIHADPEFWKHIYSDIETLEASTKDMVGDIIDGAAYVAATVAIVATAPASMPISVGVAAVTSAVAGGYHLGKAAAEWWNG